MSPAHRAAAEAELDTLTHGPRYGDPDLGSPGLIGTVMWTFGLPGVLAILGAFISIPFTGRQNTTTPLFWIWGIGSALGILLLIFAPKLMAWLEDRLVWKWMLRKEFGPNSPRASHLRADLASGRVLHTRFPITQVLIAPCPDEDVHALFLRIPAGWLYLSNSDIMDFEDALPETDDHARDPDAVALPRELSVTWLEFAGDTLSMEGHGPVTLVPIQNIPDKQALDRLALQRAGDHQRMCVLIEDHDLPAPPLR